MELLDLYEQLKTNAYPGRGIVLGLAPSGKKALIAYFIMGRSANSRNRVFDPVEAIGRRTRQSWRTPASSSITRCARWGKTPTS
mgnify:CR=1 FL=1